MEKGGRGGRGHSHSCTYFEAANTLQESKHWQWQEKGRAGKRGLIWGGKARQTERGIFNSYSKINVMAGKHKMETGEKA